MICWALVGIGLGETLGSVGLLSIGAARGSGALAICGTVFGIDVRRAEIGRCPAARGCSRRARTQHDHEGTSVRDVALAGDLAQDEPSGMRATIRGETQAGMRKRFHKFALAGFLGKNRFDI